MPAKPSKRKNRRDSLTNIRLHYFRTGELVGCGPFKLIGYIPRLKGRPYQTELEKLWLEVGKKLTRAHIKKHPGTRPFGWWYARQSYPLKIPRIQAAWPAKIQRAYLKKRNLLSKSEKKKDIDL